MNTPLISFVVPSYNVELYIEKCINSILSQTVKNIEIIPVDDGSLDKTPSILDRLAETDSRIRVIHKNNEGVSAARNTGLDEAIGEYIVFVDGDDFIAPDYAEYMMNMIFKFDSEFALSTDCFMFHGEKQDSKQYIKCYTPEDATALLLGPRVVIGCWNKIYKKEFLTRNGLRFLTTQFFGEGLLFITTATQLAKKVVVGNRKVYYYRRNNEGSACTKFNVNNFSNGYKSLDLIEDNLKIKTHKVIKMLEWHRCQFRAGALLRLQETGLVADYEEYYKESLKYVRNNTPRCLMTSGLSVFRKAMLLATCISPKIVSILQEYRRKYNVKNSVE